MAAGLNVDNLNYGVVWHSKVKWPAMQENNVWAAMDEDIDLTMKNNVFTCSKQRLRGLNNIIYQHITDKFGTIHQQNHDKQQASLSRRQREIKELRRELRGLKKR